MTMFKKATHQQPIICVMKLACNYPKKPNLSMSDVGIRRSQQTTNTLAQQQKARQKRKVKMLFDIYLFVLLLYSPVGFYENL